MIPSLSTPRSTPPSKKQPERLQRWQPQQRGPHVQPKKARPRCNKLQVTPQPRPSGSPKRAGSSRKSGDPSTPVWNSTSGCSPKRRDRLVICLTRSPSLRTRTLTPLVGGMTSSLKCLMNTSLQLSKNLAFRLRSLRSRLHSLGRSWKIYRINYKEGDERLSLSSISKQVWPVLLPTECPRSWSYLF